MTTATPDIPTPSTTARRWFSRALLRWHETSGRHDLPWQQRRDSYSVWISEIMLQQTQVTTVIPYYQRFLQRFPDLATLAAADLDEVLQYWAGLGYYSRGRNLHRCARKVAEDHQGRLPRDLAALMALPGIGRSTAAAILAFTDGQRQTILDGNVKRVLCRFHAVPGWPGQTSVSKTLWRLAEAYTPHHDVARYTQAIMDLGATVCRRHRPDCPHCPLRQRCRASAEGEASAYPQRKPRKTIPARQTTMLLLRHDNGILLEKRPASGIWGGLWSLPEYPLTNAADDPEPLSEWCHQRFGLAIDDIRPLPAFRHTFSHYHLDISPLLIAARFPGGLLMEATETLWYTRRQQPACGIPAPVQRLLDEAVDMAGGTPMAEP